MNWQQRLHLASLAVVGGLGSLINGEAVMAAESNPMFAYIGTYTGPKSQGVYRVRFNPATGDLSAPELAAKTTNPSFLAVHPNGRVLYAVGETSNLGGKRVGGVSAFAIEAATGKLELLNQQSSGGGGPCHLAVDAAGKWVLTANYGSGSIAVLPIQADGRLAEPVAIIQHEGGSVNPKRQAGPHAHFITMDPANRLALACDLGLDKVLVYRLDAAKGTLVANSPASVSVKPGAGPRHLAFHPSGRWVYVINEMGSSITAMSYEAATGVMRDLQTVSTLPESFQGASTCAEVQVHPTGKYVYGSNRGHDTIAVYAVEADSGKLSLVEHQPTQGKEPRHFTLDPSGKWLLAENQNSDTIVVFSVDAQTGRLRPTASTVAVGSPVCLVFCGGSAR